MRMKQIKEYYQGLTALGGEAEGSPAAGQRSQNVQGSPPAARRRETRPAANRAESQQSKMLVRVRKRSPTNEAVTTGRNMSITAPCNTFFSQVSAKMKEVFSPAIPPCIKSSTNLSFDCGATSKVQSGVSTGRRPLREQPKNSSNSNKVYSARTKEARSEAMSISRPQKARCQTRGEPRGVQLKQGLKFMHTKREIQLSNSGFCKSGSLYQQSYSAASRLIQQEILKQQRSKRYQNMQLQLKHILTPKEN